MPSGKHFWTHLVNLDHRIGPRFSLTSTTGLALACELGRLADVGRLPGLAETSFAAFQFGVSRSVSAANAPRLDRHSADSGGLAVPLPLLR
jgi:hypothetical protein